MHKPDWWGAFLVEYESRWGDMPKASEEANQPAFLDVWYRELQDMRLELVVSLCQRVQAEMAETRTRGKPRLSQFAGQLRILTQPWAMGKRKGSSEEEQIRTPLFRFKAGEVQRTREPFLIELPSVCQKELWRLSRDRRVGDDEEAFGAAVAVLFAAQWEDYTSEEQAEIRRLGGRAINRDRVLA